MRDEIGELIICSKAGTTRPVPATEVSSAPRSATPIVSDERFDAVLHEHAYPAMAAIAAEAPTPHSVGVLSKLSVVLLLESDDPL